MENTPIAAPEAHFITGPAEGGCIITGYTGPGGDVVVPGESGGNKVVGIGHRAFCNGTALTSVVIPEGVTSIGKSAFAHCTSLTSIVIPESVARIEWSAFEGCSALSDVVIPESVTRISWRVFEGCSALNDVVIPESVTQIGENVFRGCDALTLRVSEGSFAHQYAVNEGIPFELI